MEGVQREYDFCLLYATLTSIIHPISIHLMNPPELSWSLSSNASKKTEKKEAVM
jgi:hypothetical protein